MDDRLSQIFKDKNWDLAHFNKVLNNTAKTQEVPYNQRFGLWNTSFRGNSAVTLDQIREALTSEDSSDMRKISRYYYRTNASYRRIIDFFAYMYTYAYTLDLRNLAAEKPNKKKTLVLYDNALSLLDNLNIKNTFGYITKKVLIDGAFFGYINDFPDNHATITELDPDFCRSINKSAYGTDMVEFNVLFFNGYHDKKELTKVLKKFPKEIQQGYIKWANKENGPWVQLPPDKSCAFFMGGGGFGNFTNVPCFFDSLIDICNFNDYKEIEKKRDTQELQKILIQKFQLDEGGDFEVLLEEMAQMHEAASSLTEAHDNLDVLTTIADVSLEDTQSKSQSAASNNIDKMLLPKYENSGISSEAFYSTGASSLETSMTNATSFISQVIDKYSTWLSMFCLSRLNFGKLIPVVQILPITWYNQKAYRDFCLKNAQYGYSWILPHVVSGKSQSTLLDNIYLEQDLLGLKDKMRPLSSSFTESDGGEGKNPKAAPEKKDPMKTPGRPALDNENKSDKTIANINAK